MTATAARSMPPGLTFSMAAATGLAVANIYYNQPMLGLIQRALPGGGAGFVPTVTQLGYALGLFLLVPLGDLLERRRLIVVQFVALSVALGLAALAPTGAALLLGSLLVGTFATVAQQIVPMAAHVAPPAQRGAVIGKVMAGLLLGILLSRTLAGFVAQQSGWRAMFWLGVPLALFAAGLSRVKLPESQPDGGLSYGGLVAFLWHLWRDLPVLRRSTLTQALLFAAFSAFWSTLALQVQRLGYGPSVAGLFGIVGAAGVLAAPLAGHLAARRGPGAAIVAGTLLTAVGMAIAGLPFGIAGLVLGCIVLDLAVQGALISHQHLIYALKPDARARLNTLFMGGMFLGGALGSALAITVWQTMEWTGVCLLGSGLAAVAFTLHAAAAKRSMA